VIRVLLPRADASFRFAPHSHEGFAPGPFCHDRPRSRSKVLISQCLAPSSMGSSSCMDVQRAFFLLPSASMTLPPTLQALLSASPVPLWQGRHFPPLSAQATGFALLDQHLPGGGWPLGTLIEILPACAGIGELSLLLPTLCAFTDAGRPVAFVAPPHLPYPPAFCGHGVPLKLCVWLDVPRDTDACWATEQLLREGALVLLWSAVTAQRPLRRLQLAAETGRSLAFLFRAQQALQQPSLAAVRVALYPDPQGVRTDLLKVRGGHAARLTVPLQWPCA
jgi:hypothetical protein